MKTGVALLIEDNPILARLVQAILGRSFKIVHVTSCENAFEVFSKENFDLVISDIELDRGQTAEPFIKFLNSENWKNLILYSGNEHKLLHLKNRYPIIQSSISKNSKNWAINLNNEAYRKSKLFC